MPLSGEGLDLYLGAFQGYKFPGNLIRSKSIKKPTRGILPSKNMSRVGGFESSNRGAGKGLTGTGTGFEQFQSANPNPSTRLTE